jgi:hypothetical protein
MQAAKNRRLGLNVAFTDLLPAGGTTGIGKR